MTTACLPLRCVGMGSSGKHPGYPTTRASVNRHRGLAAIVAGLDWRPLEWTSGEGVDIPVPTQLYVIGFKDAQGESVYPAPTRVQGFTEERGRLLADLALNRRQDPLFPTWVVLKTSVLNRRGGRC